MAGTMYKKNKAEMDQGLKGVRLALKVLKDYYAKGDKDHESAEGRVAASHFFLLKLVQSDPERG